MRQTSIKPAKSARVAAGEIGAARLKNQCSGGPGRIVNRPIKNKKIKIAITMNAIASYGNWSLRIVPWGVLPIYSVSASRAICELRLRTFT
jgi:hypothetical protein